MRRARDVNAPGHDSFLDIVANMVGIVIILVMLVGVRVRHAPSSAVVPSETDPALIDAQAIEQSLTEENWALADEAARVAVEAAASRQRRDMLATLVAALEHRIRQRQEQLGVAEASNSAAATELAEARRQLERLRAEQARLAQVPEQTVVVESLPTPLSRTVDENETHFQLRGGYIAHVPVAKLVEHFKADARRKIGRLVDQPELTDTVGPEGGFRLRYTIVRRDIAPDVALATGRGGAYAELERWTLIPVADLLGEPVDVALGEGSEFQRVVASLHPGRTTITVWTYPDSFSDFRRVKEYLFRRGFATAARPLPEGVPISGSPEGSKSAAQ